MYIHIIYIYHKEKTGNEYDSMKMYQEEKKTQGILIMILFIEYQDV